jgi:RNA polymerase sigma-70 factor (ECF subfamily)
MSRRERLINASPIVMAGSNKTLIERLFAQHHGALQAFFRNRIKTKHEVADLVQEVYVRMLRVKDAEAIRNPEGYMYTVATNLFYEHAVLDRRQASHVDFDQPFHLEELTRSTGFEEAYDNRTRVKRLREVLSQLTPKCQAVVYMKYQHGLSYQEIADQLQISPHMVQKYVGLALAHCRRRMASMK